MIQIIRTNNRYTTYCQAICVYTVSSAVLSLRPGTRFSKVMTRFRTGKAVAKSQTLWLQSCLIHIFVISTKFPFIQNISGVYTSQFLHTNKLKMALQARKVPGAFEKWAPGPSWSSGRYVHLICLLFWMVTTGFAHNEFRPWSVSPRHVSISPRLRSLWISDPTRIIPRFFFTRRFS